MIFGKQAKRVKGKLSKMLRRCRERILQVPGAVREGRERFLLRKLADRADDPFPTHLPVLAGIAQLIEARFVLELGAGLHSTNAFLDKRVFPSLTRLDSYEDDPSWVRTLEASLPPDERLQFHLFPSPLWCSCADLDITMYDLVFVDNATSVEERAQTISWIADMRPDKTVVVIHDFEQRPYRQAAKSFQNRWAIWALNPATGVVWNHAPLRVRSVRQLESVIRVGVKAIPPVQAVEWASFFQARELRRIP